MKIKVLGTRGSIATPFSPESLKEHIYSLLKKFFNEGYKNLEELDEFFESQPLEHIGGFGGNTSCTVVKTSKTEIIIDAGTGIREYGYELMNGDCGKGTGIVHIFFTHFHWDHVTGLPFFNPIFVPNNEIHFYAVQQELEKIVKSMFKKPYFPVEFENLPSKIFFHQLKPRFSFTLGDLKITPYKLDHPDPCWGYKITDGKKTISYCVDTEAMRLSREELGEDLPLYQNTDLLIFDAQYTLKEAIERINWGHAAAPLGLDITIREKIPQVFFIHHDPASSTQKIIEAEEETKKYYESLKKQARWNEEKFFEVNFRFIPEGTEIEL